MSKAAIEPGIYQHYKGKKYEVLGVGCHSETSELFVVYKPLYDHVGPDLQIRPYSMFVENVVIDGKTQPRFSKCNGV